jgi:hypothetical protein
MVPEQPAAPGQNKSIDSAHLVDRPYDVSLPKPIFASSPRVQKEFTIRYIYDYAMSTYTPAATLPIVSPAQFDRTTPEGALIALVSAMQLGDYDAWLQCWDETSRKALVDSAKASNQDAAALKKHLQSAVAGRSVVLVYRLETTSYVILDTRLVSGKEQTPIFPSVFKNVSGKFLATNELGTSLLLGGWQPGIAGIDNRTSPVPIAGLSGTTTQQADAQTHFLKEHTARSEAVLPAR